MGRTDPFSGPGGDFGGLSIQTATLAGRRAVLARNAVQPIFFGAKANCGSGHCDHSRSAPRGSSFRNRTSNRSDIRFPAAPPTLRLSASAARRALRVVFSVRTNEREKVNRDGGRCTAARPRRRGAVDGMTPRYRLVAAVRRPGRKTQPRQWCRAFLID